MLDMRHVLKQRVIDDAFGLQLCVIDDTLTDECRKRSCACIHVIGRHFGIYFVPYHPSAVILFVIL